MRLMGLKGLMRLIGLMGLMGLIGLMGCSSEEEQAPTTAVQVMGYVAGFDEAQKAQKAYEPYKPYEAYEAHEAYRAYAPATRAWLPPSGYSLFGDHKVGICFTQDSQEPKLGHFFKSGSEWRTSVDITSGDYYLYGYAPHTSGLSCEITDLNETAGDAGIYSNGAILKIKNVPTVTASDLCVVIGAKNGKDDYEPDPTDYEVTGLQRGDFAYTATGSDNNYVYLLFDHLFSAMRINMRVNGEYDALRTIKLRGIYLQTSDGTTMNTSKTDITVTLEKTTNGADPISRIDYEAKGDDVGNGIIYESTAGETLGTAYTTFLCHFMPQDVNTLIMTCVYDIYDKNGNLIRQDCEATNTLEISKLFSGQVAARRGSRYTINMTIQPTYLYMMSEPDLSDPEVVVD